MIRILAAATFALCLAPAAAFATGYKTVEWSDLKAEIYGDAEILPGDGMMTLDAPIRSPNDAEVPINLSAQLFDGSAIRSVTLIIDENPMPVSAVWTFDTPRQSVSLGANMRFNGPSPLHAVIETDDGRRYMVERFVKTSGLATCSAPPVGDPKAAIASIGEMEVIDKTPPARGTPNLRNADRKSVV